jgi:hypothetical protein
MKIDRGLYERSAMIVQKRIEGDRRERHNDYQRLVRLGREFADITEQLANSALAVFLSSLPSHFCDLSFERSKNLLCLSHALRERLSGIETLAAVRTDWMRAFKGHRFPNRDCENAFALQTLEVDRLIKRIGFLLRHCDSDRTKHPRRAARAAA